MRYHEGARGCRNVPWMFERVREGVAKVRELKRCRRVQEGAVRVREGAVRVREGAVKVLDAARGCGR